MGKLWRVIKYKASAAWQGLRQWSGDSAYETYARCAMRCKGQVPLTRSQFYVDQLNKKYSRPSRCC